MRLVVVVLTVIHSLSLITISTTVLAIPPTSNFYSKSRLLDGNYLNHSQNTRVTKADAAISVVSTLDVIHLLMATTSKLL